MMTGVHVWWYLLSLVSISNITAWFYSARRLTGRKPELLPDIYRARRVLLWLSAIYVLVCAFRSFLPRIDLERICLVESWLSSMLVGRTLATIAELAFILQCAILLREAGRGLQVRTAVGVFWSVVPLVVIAEGFSWYAVITTNYLGSVIEESLWLITGILLVISFIALWPRVTDGQRYFLGAAMAYGIGFVLFMATVDVPMYWTRWLADSAGGVTYLSLQEGIQDAARMCTASFEWSVWREEIPWMTLYFTVTVWVSLLMVHAPVFLNKGQRAP